MEWTQMKRKDVGGVAERLLASEAAPRARKALEWDSWISFWTKSQADSKAGGALSHILTDETDVL